MEECWSRKPGGYTPYSLCDKASWDLLRALSERAGSDTGHWLKVPSDRLCNLELQIDLWKSEIDWFQHTSPDCWNSNLGPSDPPSSMQWDGHWLKVPLKIWIRLHLAHKSRLCHNSNPGFSDHQSSVLLFQPYRWQASCYTFTVSIQYFLQANYLFVL